MNTQDVFASLRLEENTVKQSGRRSRPPRQANYLQIPLNGRGHHANISRSAAAAMMMMMMMIGAHHHHQCRRAAVWRVNALIEEVQIWKG